MDPRMMSLITFQSRTRPFHNVAPLAAFPRLYQCRSLMCRVSLHTWLKYLPGFITRCAIEACVQQYEHNNNNVAKRHKMYQSEKPKPRNGQRCFLSAAAVAQESLYSSIIWPFISGPFLWMVQKNFCNTNTLRCSLARKPLERQSCVGCVR